MSMITACALALTWFPSVALKGSILRLGDVADLSGLPSDFAHHAAGMPLLRIPQEVLRTALPRRVIAAQIGARLPILARCFKNFPETIVIQRRVVRGAPQATGIAAREIVRGARVTLRVENGPFAIERPGTAAADALAGEPLFVRTANGQVVRTIVAGAQR